jgi:hypothetical protein
MNTKEILKKRSGEYNRVKLYLNLVLVLVLLGIVFLQRENLLALFHWLNRDN